MVAARLKRFAASGSLNTQRAHIQYHELGIWDLGKSGYSTGLIKCMENEFSFWTRHAKP